MAQSKDRTEASRHVEREPEERPMVAPLTLRKGRGALSNLQGRHEVNEREQFDDGWPTEEDMGPARAWKTQVTDEYAKTILSRNTSPDVPFSVSLNPYRGCEHEM